MIVGSNIIFSEKELKNNFGVSLEKLQEDLTLPNPEYTNMKRFGKGKFFSKIDSHICYLKKSGDNFIVPRYYFGEPDNTSETIEGRPTKYHCTITLRDYQKEFFDQYKNEINESTGLLVEAPCGHGKTSMAIYIASRRGRQTMVLVPTYYLAKQWIKSINQFTDATSVILKSTDKDVPTDRDFTVVVMDLFSVRVMPEELIKNIGHVILDEAHKIGAETYLPILNEIPATYRTALTATFRRADGVHRILKYHFGTHIQMLNRFPKPIIYAIKTGVEVPAVISRNKPHEKICEFMEDNDIPFTKTKGAVCFTVDKTFRELLESNYKKGVVNKTAYREIEKCLTKASEMSYPVVDSYLNEHSGRRKTAIKLIQECLDSGRKILFLSKRKDTLKALHKYFGKYNPMLIISETNSLSAEDEEYMQNSCPLILGVIQLAKEGLDVERLDTLIIHLPMKDTEQAIGRIARLHPDKKQPIALYLLDRNPITYAVFTNAQKFFKINGEYKGERDIHTIKSIL